MKNNKKTNDNSNKKILSFKEQRINKVKIELEEILDSLFNEYELYVYISDSYINYILDEFYKYYESKNITYSYCDNMINHFNDLAIDAIENNCDVNLEFILSELELYELLDSNCEVEPDDTRKIIKKIRGKK